LVGAGSRKQQQKEGNDVLPPGPSLMSPHSTEMVSDVRGEGGGYVGAGIGFGVGEGGE
jgi:hypothetical protein